MRALENFPVNSYCFFEHFPTGFFARGSEPAGREKSLNAESIHGNPNDINVRIDFLLRQPSQGVGIQIHLR